MNPTKGFFNKKLACLFSLMLIAIVPAVCHSATFTVNSPLDVAGLAANCVSGTGQCTLRSAIQAANASLGFPDTIILPAGTYTLTIAGVDNTAAAGDLDISGLGGALTINGAGAATTIIDGGGIDRVFETVNQPITATISGVTIRNGHAIDGLGGGITVGNGTTMTLNNVIVANCTDTAAAGGGGGGIDNSANLTMNTVAVTNNTSTGGGVNNGALGVITWKIGEVSGNIGGGINNNGTITLLENVTVSGNTSTAPGAAIDSRGSVTLQNVTISGNTSTSAGLSVGGIRNIAGGTATLRNTIISGNVPVNCGGIIASQGNNLDSGITCAFAGAGDLINTDPLLGALALNGAALIKTRALPAGSPAIDKGSATAFSPTDARGVVRPVDGNIPLDGVATSDIGAYEFRPQKMTVTLPPPFSFGTVTPGTAADHVITLANIGDGDLAIGPLAVIDPLAPPFSIPVAGDTCSNKTLPLAGSCTFTARFSPTAAALATDTFNIPSNDPAALAVSFSLSGTGGIAATGTLNNPPIIPVLVSPANGLIGGGTTMTFVWNKSTDPDGDAVSYQLIYSTDPNFAVSQTQTVDVAAAKSAGLLFAGLGSMGGGIILFGFVAGNGSRRSRTTMLGIIALILVGTLFTACGGGGGGGTPTTPANQQVSKTVTGLAANTTYYWKVVANDGKGGLTTSATFSFKTL